MDENQRQSLYQSIAISTGISTNLSSTVTAQQRKEAFFNLEQFKKYEQRVVACMDLLQAEYHILGDADISMPTKLYALDVIQQFIKKNYSKVKESERLGLRWSLLTSARQLANSNDQLPNDHIRKNGGEGARILGMKIAGVIADLAIRDFPQRWTTFVTDVFVPQEQGGIWGISSITNSNENNNNIYNEKLMIGFKIGLQCLKIVTEDCTDKDFNTKVSSARRNDVLIGLNEIASHILPLLFNLLSEQYSVVSTGKVTLQEMESWLRGSGRNVSQMTSEEGDMYNKEKNKIGHAARIVVDCLVTLEKFCLSMPLDWMMGNKYGLNFVAAYIHLLRENTFSIQIKALACLEALASRKLEFDAWFLLLTSLPQAVSEANRLNQQECIRDGEDFLVQQFTFHRKVSRMLASLISSHIAHITTEKEIIHGKGAKFRSLESYLSLLCDMLGHPSGLVCGEQINTWVALLHDPQISNNNDILIPHLPNVLQSYITHLARIRWEDVEDQVHPMASVMEISWDDKTDYDLWLANQRSKGSLLFKHIGNHAPELATTILKNKFQEIFVRHGNGEPRNHVDKATNYLTPKSEAIMQFDGIHLPFDTILQGLPTWSVRHDYPLSHPAKLKIRDAVRSSLGLIANLIINWNPTDPHIRIQQASFLTSLKHYWKYDASTLPQGVKILLNYLQAKDDKNVIAMNNTAPNFSNETIALKKKCGICLVSISNHIPHLLVPWLADLSVQAKTILATDELLSLNRMHMYEFLSCVATAVEDPIARVNFISDVLSSSFEVLESKEVTDTLASMDTFLMSLGISQARSNPGFVIDHENVRNITDKYTRLFSAVNQLLSVGKRCHQAAKKRPNCGLPMQNINEDISNLDVDIQENFPDEGPVSINELVFNDPFVPLWHRLLPIVLRIADLTFSLWHPTCQAAMLPNAVQRYVFAISDDEVYLAKKQESGNSGVFGEGGTAGSVISGWDRRKHNLAPRWSGWFNELRNTSFQFLGLLADQRVLFAPEMSDMFPQFVSVVCNPDHLRAMEHRHFTQYLKQFVENMMVSCPTPLYQTHLAPVLVPVLEHVRYRLRYTWAPILETNNSVSIKALSTQDCEAVAALASRGGDEWYCSYYARAGVFTGELDETTSEAVVEKARVELTRVFCDVIQTSLALRGEWALVLANQAKREQAIRKNDPSKLNVGPKSSISNDRGQPVNADGTPRSANHVALEKRHNLRIHKICQFLLLENEAVAGPLVLNIIECISYPDAYTCRRCTRICHRILEAASSIDRYTNLLGYKLFLIVVKAIVTEPKWMVGIEWDMIALLRDIYCRLVLGQVLQPGGQGPGLQQPLSSNRNSFEQAKYVDRPLQGGGILCVPSNLPREILLELPGVNAESIQLLDNCLNEKRAAKDQKDSLREILRTAAEELKRSEDKDGNAADNGILGRANIDESYLSQENRIGKEIPDIPEKLFTSSQQQKQINTQMKLTGVDMLGSGGLSNIFT